MKCFSLIVFYVVFLFQLSLLFRFESLKVEMKRNQELIY